MGYWLVFKTVYVNNAGGEKVVGDGDGGFGGVGHGGLLSVGEIVSLRDFVDGKRGVREIFD